MTVSIYAIRKPGWVAGFLCPGMHAQPEIVDRSGQLRRFPYAIRDRLTCTVARDEPPTVTLAFLAEHVDTDGPILIDADPTDVHDLAGRVWLHRAEHTHPGTGVALVEGPPPAEPSVAVTVNGVPYPVTATLHPKEP